eukprot:COSAG05_NODE_3176_length_2266_cov_1.677896_1_plen_320_part_00
MVRQLAGHAEGDITVSCVALARRRIVSPGRNRHYSAKGCCDVTVDDGSVYQAAPAKKSARPQWWATAHAPADFALSLPVTILCDILLLAAVDAKAISVISCVCRCWHSHTRTEIFWQRVCLARWPTTSQSLPLVKEKGGFSEYYKNRHLSCSRKLPCSAEAAATSAEHFSWMIDLLDVDGSSLFTDVISRTAEEWLSSFPTVVEAKLLHSFAVLSQNLAQIRVSVSILRCSDLKTVGIVNDGTLQKLRGVPQAAEGLYSIARGSIDTTKSSYQNFLRVELDGTDPANSSQAVLGVMVESGVFDSTLPEFVSAMLLADWA